MSLAAPDPERRTRPPAPPLRAASRFDVKTIAAAPSQVGDASRTRIGPRTTCVELFECQCRQSHFTCGASSDPLETGHAFLLFFLHSRDFIWCSARTPSCFCMGVMLKLTTFHARPSRFSSKKKYKTKQVKTKTRPDSGAERSQRLAHL